MKKFKTFEEMIENKNKPTKQMNRNNNISQTFQSNISNNSKKPIINLSSIKKKNTQNSEKESDYKLTMSAANSTKLDNMKQEMINYLEQEKNLEKKHEPNNSKISKSKIKNNRSASASKNNKKIEVNNNYNSYNENKFEKYNKENLTYQLYHEYQKLNFNEASIPFIKRMELYALKKFMRDYKIQELLKMQSPKLSEKHILNTFNRLIEDSNRRNSQSNKRKNNNIVKSETNIKKPFNKKKWDEIYENRFGSKLRERNERLEKLRTEKKMEEMKEEEKILDDMKIKQDNINKKFYSRFKSHKNSKKFDEDALKELNQRLYYNEINKKDINYKAFVDQLQENINNNEDIEKNKNPIKPLNYFNFKSNRNKENNAKTKNSFGDGFKKSNIKEDNKNINNSSKSFNNNESAKKNDNSKTNSSIISIDLEEMEKNDIQPENKRVEKIISGFFEN